MSVASPLPETILISGASSGIGEALALVYARAGTTLALSGRDRDRLEHVARACREKGATAMTEVVDVADAHAMRQWIIGFDTKTPIDLVIANAGISSGTSGADDDEERYRALFAVNVDGVLNTILPIIPRMRARQTGQIALVSSIAGYRGFAGASAYCGTKAAVKVLGEGLRLELAEFGIRVSVVCPGYVVSRMTDKNKFPMPFIMSADRAADIIAKGLRNNRGRITFPIPMAFIVWLLSAMPPAWIDPILRRLPRKD